ncbi:MAG: FHA domain-containing protein [Myxococcales bacterium]|nr:FHA domain-containing protein [Myxococcales bacterium]
MGATLQCSHCGAEVPVEHRFCGACGSPMKSAEPSAAKTEFFGGPATAGKPARLILIRGEGMDGVSYHLNANEHIAGRKAGAILFPEDHYLSPRHANFFYENGQLMVKDEGSLNGVFVRIQDRAPLGHGDVFLAGEELLQVHWTELASGGVSPDHTHFFGSPLPISSRRITQIFEGGRPGLTHLVRGGTVSIGREGCDLDFPYDRFISGSHCRVEFGPDGATLVDEGSRNGTYVRIQGPRPLAHGDYLFVGKQLLRVEMTAAGGAR